MMLPPVPCPLPAAAASAKAAVVVKSDQLYAQLLCEQAHAALPGWSIQVASSIAAADLLLARGGVLITALEPELSDVFGLLASASQRETPFRTLILIGHDEDRFLAVLRDLPVDGVFDPVHDSPENLALAVANVAHARHYWSPSVLQRLRRHDTAPDSPARVLTATQQIVLSLVGDGSDDRDAARALGLSRTTIATIRRQLHRKLGVQHRGELIRLAAQHGFVRFTSAGVVRPDWVLLIAAYTARRTGRAQMSPGKARA